MRVVERGAKHPEVGVEARRVPEAGRLALPAPWSASLPSGMYGSSTTSRLSALRNLV